MDVFLRIDINLVAMVLLGITCLIACGRLDMKDQLNRAFLVSGVIIILELLFESTTCIINGRPEPWAVPVSAVLHICLFSVAPVLAYFWFLMIRHWVVSEDKTSRRKNLLLLIPAAVNLILVLLSPGYGMVFYLDSDAVYHRGPSFIVFVLVVYFYFLCSVVLICLRREKVVKEEFIPLLIVGILPMIGGILQSMFYGLLLMWSSAGFSLIVVYIFLQQRMVHLDDLTGAWTRGTFEYVLSRKARRKKNDVFGLILLDMDGLKAINDRYGHFEGDYALKTTVQLIKSVLRKGDIIARTGGDEFLIILDCDSRERIDQTIERIEMTLKQHNETTKKDYRLECSIGAELFDSGFTDVDHLMRRVDELMYINKRSRKSCPASGQ